MIKVTQSSRQKTNENGTLRNGGYVNADDTGWCAERTLFIEDSEGKTATLKNEEIGELISALRLMYPI